MTCHALATFVVPVISNSSAQASTTASPDLQSTVVSAACLLAMLLVSAAVVVFIIALSKFDEMPHTDIGTRYPRKNSEDTSS